MITEAGEFLLMVISECFLGDERGDQLGGNYACQALI